MSIVPPVSIFEVELKKADDTPELNPMVVPNPNQTTHRAKDSEGLHNRGQLELDSQNVLTGGLEDDSISKTDQIIKRNEKQKTKTVSKNALIVKGELNNDIHDPALKKTLDILSLSPELIRKIGTDEKSQLIQKHIFRDSIEGHNFNKRIKAIFDTVIFRDDYSRTLVYALTSKYDRFTEELINELTVLLQVLLGSKNSKLDRTDADAGKSSILSLTEDIRRYSHANAVIPDDDLTVLHHTPMELAGMSVIQISGKFLIIDQYINFEAFKEIKIADLSSMTPIKIFANRKILSTYTLKDQPDKLFIIEAVVPENDEQEHRLPVVYLTVYDTSDFDEPIASIDCHEAFSDYDVDDCLKMNHHGRLCATGHGMLVYRCDFDGSYTHHADVVLCTADSIARVEIDTLILDVGRNYNDDYIITMIVFDGGRQIAYYGWNTNNVAYITIIQVKLSQSEGIWKLSAESISETLTCGSTNIRYSYGDCTDKIANTSVTNIVWDQDDCLVTYVDGLLINLTMEPPRLINNNLEGTPLQIIENEDDYGSLNQLSVAKKNKNAADDILSTEKEVIDCTLENILNISQPGKNYSSTVVSENLLMVEISTSVDRRFLAFFQKRSKTHYELSTVLALNNKETNFTLTTDGKYLLRITDKEVISYELAISDPIDGRHMLIDDMSTSQIHATVDLRVTGSHVQVVDRQTGKLLFDTDVRLRELDDTLLVIKAWMSEDATVLYVSYRIGPEGFCQVHVIAFTIEDGVFHKIDNFEHHRPVDRMTACGDLIVFGWAVYFESTSNSQSDTITRLRGVSKPDHVSFEGIEVQYIQSLRYEDYGENRLLYVTGLIGLKDKEISWQHCFFALRNGKYQVIEIV